jgi:quercetin dioxygenase-like cupin family protein
MVSHMNNSRAKVLLQAGALTLGLTFASAGTWAAEGQEDSSGFLSDPTSANFQTAAGVPECTTFDVLRGDMAASSSTMMVRMAPGCVVPYQWHSPSEELVMLRGQIEAQFLGESVLNLENGAYLLIPTGKPHRFRCSSQEPCVMFIAADAAFDIHFVDQDGTSISAEEVEAATEKYAKEEWGS